jgi:hypothetical protein
VAELAPLSHWSKSVNLPDVITLLGEFLNWVPWLLGAVVACGLAVVLFITIHALIVIRQTSKALLKVAAEARDLGARALEEGNLEQAETMAALNHAVDLTSSAAVLFSAAKYRPGDLRSLAGPLQMVFGRLSSEESQRVLVVAMQLEKADDDPASLSQSERLLATAITRLLGMWKRVNCKRDKVGGSSIESTLRQVRVFLAAGVLTAGTGSNVDLPGDGTPGCESPIVLVQTPAEYEGPAMPITPAACPIESTQAVEADSEPEVRVIPFRGYLRSLWTLFWTALRHPLTTTAIDLSTGKVVTDEDSDDGEIAQARDLV